MPTATFAAPGTEEPQGLCVLIAEDDEADAYLISHTLSGFAAVGKVVRAKDGVEALTMIERGDVAPDLAFIDLHMPRMDGFDLLVALSRTSRPSFPMVVLTSSGARNDAIKSRLRNAIRVVTKPDTVAELYAVLVTAIEATCPAGARAAFVKPYKTPDYLFQASVGEGSGLRIRRTSTVDQDA
jgi:CheY-like chemotaxis protein